MDTELDNTRAELIPSQLRQRLTRRQCAAFVGAGFSMACGMPQWSQLLTNMLELAHESLPIRNPSLGTCKTALDRGNFTLAASILRACLPPADMDEAIRRNFGLHRLDHADDGSRRRMQDRMKNLATGPWAGILTTNYDELIEHGLNQWSKVERVSASGTDPRLGAILNVTPPSGLFFVKLHGSVSGSGIVLSTDEYDRTYLSAPQMLSFLTGLMLRYHLVFIGCSLEDEIVRMRRDLTRKFRGMIPSAYALLQETEDNKARQSWLRELAQIETIFYPSNDKSHVSVDRFLSDSALAADPIAQPNQTFPANLSTLDRYRKAEPLERLRMAGLENQRILQLICSMENKSLHHRDLVNPARTGAPEGDLLSNLSPSELTYRALFLISIGLLEEKGSPDGERAYRISDRVVDALDALRRSGTGSISASLRLRKKSRPSSRN